jgi:acyl-CoA thioester hydrolase
MRKLNDYLFTVQETDLDLYGHVNNATYLKFLEQARWSIVRNKGFSADEILKNQIGPVVLEVNLKFLKEISCGQKMIVKSELIEQKEIIGKIRHQIISNQDSLHCEALITFGLFDLKLRKLIPPTDKWKICLGLL